MSIREEEKTEPEPAPEPVVSPTHEELDKEAKGNEPDPLSLSSMVSVRASLESDGIKVSEDLEHMSNIGNGLDDANKKDTEPLVMSEHGIEPKKEVKKKGTAKPKLGAAKRRAPSSTTAKKVAIQSELPTGSAIELALPIPFGLGNADASEEPEPHPSIPEAACKDGPKKTVVPAKLGVAVKNKKSSTKLLIADAYGRIFTEENLADDPSKKTFSGSDVEPEHVKPMQQPTKRARDPSVSDSDEEHLDGKRVRLDLPSDQKEPPEYEEKDLEQLAKDYEQARSYAKGGTGKNGERHSRKGSKGGYALFGTFDEGPKIGRVYQDPTNLQRGNNLDTWTHSDGFGNTGYAPLLEKLLKDGPSTERMEPDETVIQTAIALRDVTDAAVILEYLEMLLDVTVLSKKIAIGSKMIVRKLLKGVLHQTLSILLTYVEPVTYLTASTQSLLLVTKIRLLNGALPLENEIQKALTLTGVKREVTDLYVAHVLCV